MATPTNELRLELQTPGTNDSTWGDIANVNLMLLEDAISGLKGIATTGGDTTLSTNAASSNYAASEDQARYAILKITGALVSNANIIVPAKHKKYAVWNATSGAYTVTVKVSGGTGIAVTQGKRAVLICDGAEVYSAVTDTAGLGAALDSEVIKQGVHSMWIPAAAMVSRTTNGPATGSAETATYKIMRQTLDFDAATPEYAQFSFRAPKSWNEGSFTAVFVWSHAATTVNFGVVWGIMGLAISDGELLDAAFSAGDGATDTGGVTDTVYHSPETAAFSVSGSVTEGDFIVMQVYRSASAGADTLAIDARLHGILLKYTINAATDA